jgi:TRAP-type C4-dicarboxylate transport system substrate-binding protein
MLEPLLMAKSIFDTLPKDQQQAITQVGAEMEKFGTEQAKVDDKQVADIYAKAGAKVYDLDDKAVKKWQGLARDTAWKDFAAKSANCARLLQLAEKTL